MNKFVFVFALLGVMACGQSGHVTGLSATAFEAAIAVGDVQLLDVRTAREYQQGHIANALQIDYLQRSAFREQAERQLDPSRPIYIYCNRGPRSQGAARVLRDLGFTEIYELKGGYQAWINR